MSEAIQFFADRLRFQTDPSDVYAAQQAGTPFVIVDSRGEPGWRQGHIPGALHLPTTDIPARAADLIDPATPVITYCWGNGCNGATRAALAFAHLGYEVKEMIGGIEYWTREGFPVETAVGTTSQPIDPLTAPLTTITCDC
ncbi:rhodanese-like domain-containing protein [Actinocrispum sp. NPDC049592]|uniref:rhodanese-like domain-containing protein n=1 Tax=Actinocrispum sp. NPDC049592 TaxID=3154835 RepID=UPI00343611E1